MKISKYEINRISAALDQLEQIDLYIPTVMVGDLELTLERSDGGPKHEGATVYITGIRDTQDKKPTLFPPRPPGTGTVR